MRTYKFRQPFGVCQPPWDILSCRTNQCYTFTFFVVQFRWFFQTISLCMYRCSLMIVTFTAKRKCSSSDFDSFYTQHTAPVSLCSQCWRGSSLWVGVLKPQQKCSQTLNTGSLSTQCHAVYLPPVACRDFRAEKSTIRRQQNAFLLNCSYQMIKYRTWAVQLAFR